MIRLALTGLLIAWVANAPAWAQTRLNAADLAGVWMIETETFTDIDCVLTGELVLQADGGALRCALSISQSCALSDDFGPIHTTQSCTARVANSALIIRSAVETVEPDTFAESYLADNFSLRVTAPDRMDGIQHSASLRPLKAVFTRLRQPIS